MGPEDAVAIATIDDADAVTRLLATCYGELMRPAYDADVLAAALPAMTRANPMLLASGTYYVVRDHDRAVIGCGGWTPQKPGGTQVEPNVAHLRHFAIHPGSIGRGIGRRIYRQCETDASADGRTTFDVFASLNAVPFYAALGFRKLEDITVAMGPGIGFPSTWMRRAI